MLCDWQLCRLRRVFVTGGLIAYPTEGVYGLGCDPWNRAAVAKLLHLKSRNIRKGLIVVMSDITQGQKLLSPFFLQRIDALTRQATKPITWIVPAKSTAPYWVTGGRSKIAVRLSKHPIINELCSQFGALISTSANLPAHPPANRVDKVRRYFGHWLDYIISDNGSMFGRPSEIRDLVSGCVIRYGGAPLVSACEDYKVN